MTEGPRSSQDISTLSGAVTAMEPEQNRLTRLVVESGVFSAWLQQRPGVSAGTAIVSSLGLTS